MSEEFLSQFKEEEIVALSGISSATFHKIWSKYCGRSTPIRRPIYLWWLFLYYKIYPVSRAFRCVYGMELKSRYSFISRLHKWQVSLAIGIDVIDSLR